MAPRNRVQLTHSKSVIVHEEVIDNTDYTVIDVHNTCFKDTSMPDAWKSRIMHILPSTVIEEHTGLDENDVKENFTRFRFIGSYDKFPFVVSESKVDGQPWRNIFETWALKDCPFELGVTPPTRASHIG